jgi:hypothetical protein
MESQTQKSNEEILKELKDELAKEMSGLRFTFEPSGDSSIMPRKPNEKERRDFLMDSFRYLYKNTCGTITQAQYYTMKGHIKRYQFDILYNFLKNSDLTFEVGEMQKNLAKYSETECIVDRTIQVTFPGVHKVARIEIDLNIPKDKEATNG